jgi:hypothetical protein
MGKRNTKTISVLVSVAGMLASTAQAQTLWNAGAI